MIDFDFLLGLRASEKTIKTQIPKNDPCNIPSLALTGAPLDEIGLTALFGGGGDSPALTMPPPDITLRLPD